MTCVEVVKLKLGNFPVSLSLPEGKQLCFQEEWCSFCSNPHPLAAHLRALICSYRNSEQSSPRGPAVAAGALREGKMGEFTVELFEVHIRRQKGLPHCLTQDL